MFILSVVTLFVVVLTTTLVSATHLRSIHPNLFTDGRLIYESATPTESIDLSNQGLGVYMLCCERIDHSHTFEKIIIKY